jgi:hypothetical protein
VDAASSFSSYSFAPSSPGSAPEGRHRVMLPGPAVVLTHVPWAVGTRSGGSPIQACPVYRPAPSSRLLLRTPPGWPFSTKKSPGASNGVALARASWSTSQTCQQSTSVASEVRFNGRDVTTVRVATVLQCGGFFVTMRSRRVGCRCYAENQCREPATKVVRQLVAASFSPRRGTLAGAIKKSGVGKGGLHGSKASIGREGEIC